MKLDGTGYQMLARNESITGWLTVINEHDRNVTILRSGHSIIGGVFNDYGESIFDSFYYMEGFIMSL